MIINEYNFLWHRFTNGKNGILFWERITFCLMGVQSQCSQQWTQKSIANVYLLLLICNGILCILSLKMSFHTARCYQILIPILKHTILIEHIHCLEGIFRILFVPFLFAFEHVVIMQINHFQLKIMWKLLNCR